ncbi:hypothetical protein [Streptomyces griseocarneus]|uniref:hypothetical protein n=1 Tax=Streptomyces griseocarneus TaxID=51201 RepID=UPI00167D23E6|nr:hypothetical protein [Streptomyces griseocarneus]MBZ6476647.1 hypothetical protein [Streptomyces griseocarneus]GHG80125.1 hypothetical protein GCM10018779_61400 [Streptomyces griseocarneus]
MTSENLARLAAARAHRDLSDLARQGVGSISSAVVARERIEAARRLRVMVNDLLDLVVLGEALGGEPWEEITCALCRRDVGAVRAEYDDAITQWQAVPATALHGVVGDARDLDAWYRRHREDTDPPAENPVSDLLQAD